jgi:hypothetical protein
MGRYPDDTRSLALDHHGDDATGDADGHIERSVWAHLTPLGRTTPAGRSLTSRDPGCPRHNADAGVMRANDFIYCDGDCTSS